MHWDRYRGCNGNVDIRSGGHIDCGEGACDVVGLDSRVASCRQRPGFNLAGSSRKAITAMLKLGQYGIQFQ